MFKANVMYVCNEDLLTVIYLWPRLLHPAPRYSLSPADLTQPHTYPHQYQQYHYYCPQLEPELSVCRCEWLSPIKRHNPNSI